MPHTRSLLMVSLLLFAAACTDQPPTGTAKPVDPDPERPAPVVLGAYEFTLTGIGGSSVSASIAPAGEPVLALTPVTAGLAFEEVSSSTFTDGPRGKGGHRYFTFTYRVRNSTGAPITNLTMMMATTAATIQGSPFSGIKLFSGVNAVPALAPQIVPTGAVALAEDGSMRSLYPDVLQVFTEAEASAITLPSGFTGVLPYGFVVRNPDVANSRTLPVAASPNEWSGMLTFAFRVPLAASAQQDAFSISFPALAVVDSETRVTESIEEGQDTAAVRRVRERATALSATTVTVLNGSTATAADVADYPGQRQLCSVRTAGTAATPTSFITRPAAYRKVALLYPGEVMDPCTASFRAGDPGRPATNVPFNITAMAVDLYGNVITTAVDTINVRQLTGPTVTLGAAQPLVAGASTLTVTYADYGTSLLGAVGRRNDGWRPVPVAGVTREWKGHTNEWHTPGNWFPAAVPMALDSVWIPVPPANDPVLSSNVQVAGVKVDDGAVLDLGAFDLTATADVATGLTGGFASTVGRLVLTGTAETVEGRLPRVLVTGTYSLSANITTRATLRVQGGRLRTAGFRIRTESF